MNGSFATVWLRRGGVSVRFSGGRRALGSPILPCKFPVACRAAAAASGSERTNARRKVGMSRQRWFQTAVPGTDMGEGDRAYLRVEIVGTLPCIPAAAHARLPGAKLVQQKRATEEVPGERSAGWCQGPRAGGLLGRLAVPVLGADWQDAGRNQRGASSRPGVGAAVFPRVGGRPGRLGDARGSLQGPPHVRRGGGGTRPHLYGVRVQRAVPRLSRRQQDVGDLLPAQPA
jgi:hypothetical protein